MWKGLSSIGALLTAIVVGAIAVVATSAGGPPATRPSDAVWIGGAASPMPPPCDEICGEETACDEVCRYGSDMTCGEYYGEVGGETCVSCSTVCGPFQACEMACLEGVLTDCETALYECGGSPPEDCSQVCAESTVKCSASCWNGSSYSTCLAEEYPCGVPCWEPESDYSGLFEVGGWWDPSLPGYRVHCYAHVAEFEWDFCQDLGFRDLSCGWESVEYDIPEGTCTDTYGHIYGYENVYGC